jgi:hypothetical protein
MYIRIYAYTHTIIDTFIHHIHHILTNIYIYTTYTHTHICTYTSLPHTHIHTNSANKDYVEGRRVVKSAKLQELGGQVCVCVCMYVCILIVTSNTLSFSNTPGAYIGEEG